jgi:hypothetical protein
VPDIATTHYRYELLIDSLKAYVTGDPHIMTRKLLEGEGLSDKFHARIAEVGSEICQHDFKWVCLDLNQRHPGAIRGQHQVGASRSGLGQLPRPRCSRPWARPGKRRTPDLSYRATTPRTAPGRPC